MVESMVEFSGFFGGEPHRHWRNHGLVWYRTAAAPLATGLEPVKFPLVHYGLLPVDGGASCSDSQVFSFSCSQVWDEW